MSASQSKYQNNSATSHRALCSDLFQVVFNILPCMQHWLHQHMCAYNPNMVYYVHLHANLSKLMLYIQFTDLLQLLNIQTLTIINLSPQNSSITECTIQRWKKAHSTVINKLSINYRYLTNLILAPKPATLSVLHKLHGWVILYCEDCEVKVLKYNVVYTFCSHPHTLTTTPP